MKARIICTAAIALSVVACGEKPPPAEEAPAPPPVEEAVAIESPESPPFVNEAFIEHMHTHADQVDEIMIALSDDDLEGAKGPAAWLYRHEEVEGIPSEWQPFLIGMREAASTVESALDLEVARSAGERIVANCQGCHTAAGINVGVE
jgi:hypothetical protein